MISPTMLRLARPAILAWICRMLRSVKVASATISLTICGGVGGLPMCLPRASAARIPAVTRSLISDDLQLGHGADDGEHRPAHGTFGIDLILRL